MQNSISRFTCIK